MGGVILCTWVKLGGAEAVEQWPLACSPKMYHLMRLSTVLTCTSPSVMCAQCPLLMEPSCHTVCNNKSQQQIAHPCHTPHNH